MADLRAQPLYGVKCLPVEDTLCQISVWIHRTIPTLLLIIGTIGNTVNIFVLSRKNIRATPCFLLVFLALFDILFLFSMYIEAPFGLNFGIEHGSLSFLACSILTWLATSSSAASLWTVAIFTVERMLFVMIPHRNDIHLTRNKSILITGIITLVLSATLGALIIGDDPSEIHANMTNGSVISHDDFACWRTSVQDPTWREILHTAVLFFCNIIPFLVVVIGNIILLVHLCRRRRVGSATDSQTLLLLMITGLMLATLAPFGGFVVAFQVLSSTLDKSYPLSELLFSIVYSLVMANHALNFALYAWKGTLFKKEYALIWAELKSLRCFCR